MMIRIHTGEQPLDIFAELMHELSKTLHQDQALAISGPFILGPLYAADGTKAYTSHGEILVLQQGVYVPEGNFDPAQVPFPAPPDLSSLEIAVQTADLSSPLCGPQAFAQFSGLPQYENVLVYWGPKPAAPEFPTSAPTAIGPQLHVFIGSLTNAAADPHYTTPGKKIPSSGPRSVLQDPVPFVHDYLVKTETASLTEIPVLGPLLAGEHITIEMLTEYAMLARGA